MALLISLGSPLKDGDQISPDALHALIDNATISGNADSGGDLSSVNFFTYGSTRPTLQRGAAHYDTTAGLEGMVFAFVSASNASVSAWLYGTPRRESLCWTSSAVSAYTPVFVGQPSHVANLAEYTIYDGTLFPNVWQYSGASGPDSAMFMTVESAAASSPVRCAWAGLLPDAVLLGGTTSNASTGSPLFVDYADPGAFKAGRPTPRSFIYGVNTRNGSSGAGAILWGCSAAIEDISA